MIQKVRIQNFKSVLDLELELGQVNVFIGENGSGKTSVLEGIAMGSAASQDKLDEEFLVTRGIRVVDSHLMKSAFHENYSSESVAVYFSTTAGDIVFELDVLGTSPREWRNAYEVGTLPDLKTLAADAASSLKSIESTLSQFRTDYQNGDIEESTFRGYEKSLVSAIQSMEKNRERINELNRPLVTIAPFLLYAPENHFLRRFEEEGQIRPLGIRGEGLFRHLTELAKEEPETLAKISEQLGLIDWFEGFSIPTDLQFTERRIAITDRFIKDTIAQIDQRSANEGFLYLLFYFTLFLSKYTPAFFAIDNIDNALNPRLCAKLVETLVTLAKENGKQAIFTTHNPAVLDGLDLEDDEQRLFVIYRNRDGETKARRVMPLQEVEGVETPLLSEAFMRGYLGGLPQNF